RSVRVISAARISADRGLGIAEIQIELGRSVRLHERNVDPDERNPQQTIVGVDVELQRRLVIDVDKAKIASVLLGVGKAEVAVVQTDQYGNAAGVFGERTSGCTGIYRDLLAVGPIAVPPSVRGAGDHQKHGEKQAQERPS